MTGNSPGAQTNIRGKKRSGRKRAVMRSYIFAAPGPLSCESHVADDRERVAAAAKLHTTDFNARAQEYFASSALRLLCANFNSFKRHLKKQNKKKGKGGVGFSTFPRQFSAVTSRVSLELLSSAARSGRVQAPAAALVHAG